MSASILSRLLNDEASTRPKHASILMVKPPAGYVNSVCRLDTEVSYTSYVTQ